jgi:hypothetical protein
VSNIDTIQNSPKIVEQTSGSEGIISVYSLKKAYAKLISPV